MPIPDFDEDVFPEDDRLYRPEPEESPSVPTPKVPWSATLRVLEGFKTAGTVLASADIGDGRTKSLVGFHDGTFEVRIADPSFPDAEILVSKSSGPLAVIAHVYDCCDTPRNWATAWLPRGTNIQTTEKKRTVFAAASSPEAAIMGFLDSLGVEIVVNLNVKDLGNGRWTADILGGPGRDYFKVMGTHVPGGCIIDGWTDV